MEQQTNGIAAKSGAVSLPEINCQTNQPVLSQVLLHRPVLRAGEEVERGACSVREGVEIRQGGAVESQEPQQPPESWSRGKLEKTQA